MYLDEIPNGTAKAFYQFDNFLCEPEDCCYLDYTVVKEKNPLAVIESTEIELQTNFPVDGKNSLNFKIYGDA